MNIVSIVLASCDWFSMLVCVALFLYVCVRWVKRRMSGRATVGALIGLTLAFLINGIGSIAFLMAYQSFRWDLFSFGFAISTALTLLGYLVYMFNSRLH